MQAKKRAEAALRFLAREARGATCGLCGEGLPTPAQAATGVTVAGGSGVQMRVERAAGPARKRKASEEPA